MTAIRTGTVARATQVSTGFSRHITTVIAATPADAPRKVKSPWVNNVWNA